MIQYNNFFNGDEKYNTIGYKRNFISNLGT
jgi:hypothetical protein